MNKKFLSAILFGALMITSTGTFVSCKDYDDDINDVQGQVDTNKSALSTLTTQLTSLQTALSSAQSTADAAKAAADAAKAAGDTAKAEAETAKAAAAQAKADAIAEATKQVEALKAIVEANKLSQDELAAAMAVVSGKIEAIETGLSELTPLVDKALADIVAVKADLDEQKAALEALKNSTKTDAAIEEINATIEELYLELQSLQGTVSQSLWACIEDVDAALTRISELEGKAETLEYQVGQLSITLSTLIDDAATKEEVQELWEAIYGEGSSIQTQMTQLYNSLSEGISTLNVLVKSRLTSLLFAPTLYVDGIEAIPFTTLKYLPWGDLKKDDALASHTTAPDSVAISDNSTEAHYYVSPSNVDLTSIAKLNVLVQKDAQNIQSRAAAPEIEATMGEVVNGKMAVNFKKNATTSFGAKGNKFSVMALQAELTKEADEETATLVTSDWARIYETHVVPYIHNIDAETENDYDAHFWTYAQIHSKEGSVVEPSAECDTKYGYIAKELVFNETTSLFDLVDVCDKDGMSLDYKDYGMTFDFALMEYNLKYCFEDAEMTNQAKFAKIDENGNITSCAYDGTANNEDAIGREPMIQAVLKDTVNNKVVDVRYFKIKWIAKKEVSGLGQLAGFSNEFECGKTYKDTIGTEAVNVKIYTALNISKEDFHALYWHSTSLFESLDDLNEGNADATLGTFDRIVSYGSSSTFNYEWQHSIDNITETDYDAGKIIKTAYGYFYKSSNDKEKHYFTLTDTIVIPQMGITGYVSTQWNKTPVANDGSKIFQVNPALTSDVVNGISYFFDCQMTANFLKGYNNKDVAPADLTISDITNETTTTSIFVFDKDRIAEVLGEGWSVSNDGLKLSKGTEIAAVIEGTNISLYENPEVTPFAHGKPTDAAQALLDNKVPVKLVGKNCAGIEKTLDKFLVHFIDPLKMTVDQKETVLKDLITGSSKVDVSKAVQIFEKFGLKRGVVYLDEDGNLVTDPELVQWYNVGTVTWDIENAKTNLKFSGNDLVIDGENIAHSWKACENYYQLEVNDEATELSFHNNSGSHIQQEFKVAVPVYVQTKWNPALADPTKATVILTIKPGDYE